MTPEEAFGRVLRRLREARGFTQESLGFESGYTRVYVGMLERGEGSPTVAALFRLAQPLDVRPSQLLALVEEEGPTISPREGRLRPS